MELMLANGFSHRGRSVSLQSGEFTFKRQFTEY